MAKKKQLNKFKLLAVALIILVLTGIAFYFKFTEKERVIEKYLAVQKNVKDYTVTIENEKSGFKSTSAYSCSENIYKAHFINMTADVTTDTIQIGKDIYIKDPMENNVWWKSIRQTKDGIATLDSDKFCTEEYNELEKQLTKGYGMSAEEYEYVRKEQCGEMNCFVFRLLDKNNLFSDIKETLILFDDQKYLTRERKYTFTHPSAGNSRINYSYEPTNITKPQGEIRDIPEGKEYSSFFLELLYKATDK